MKKLKFCVVFLLAAAMMTNAQIWYGLEDGDVWSDASNWIGGSGGVPGVSDWAEIIYDFPKTCILDSDAGIINTLHISAGGTGASMVIKNGGSLTVSGGDVSPGWNNNGTLTIETGGSLTANCMFTVAMYDDTDSFARLILNGGTLTVNNAFYHGIYFDGSSTVDIRTEINAGVLDVDALILDRGIMNIANGTVIVAGDVLGLVANWVSAGRLTAFDGAGTIVAQLGDGYTEITAVPEPSMLALLALSTLMLHRKR